MMNTTRTLRSALICFVTAATAVSCRSKSKADDDPGFVRTPNYKYSELIVKDYDEMQAMVTSQVRKATQGGNDGADVEMLQGTLKLILTRPDSDNMVSKLIPEVRRELAPLGAFERVVAQIAAEAVDNIRNKDQTASVRTSSSFILENLLAEIRPEAEREDGEMRKTVRRIAEARLTLPDEVRRDRKLRGMYSSKNPSEEAGRIVSVIETRERAEKKARELVDKERARAAKKAAK